MLSFPRKKETLFLIADIILISLSVFLSFLLRFDWQIPPKYFLNIAVMISLALSFSLPTFYFLRLYSFSFEYFSLQEIFSLAKGVALSFLFSAASLFILKDNPIFSGFPRSTIFISYLLIFFFTGGIRFSKRFYLQIIQDQTKENKERILIVGAGNAGEQILRNILNSKNSSFLPIGFVDDNPSKLGVIIHGMKVLGKTKDISQVIKENEVEGLIVALPSAGSKAIKRVVEIGRKAGLKKIKIIPSIAEIMDGQVSLGAVRDVEIEDLLGREPVRLDQKLIEDFINGKKVLITGAAGSIGSELSRQIAKFNPSSLLLLDQDETGIFNISKELAGNFPKLRIYPLVVDIRDDLKINQIFKEFLPDLIFHAAAYKHVPLMEEHPDEAVKNNIFGTEVIAKAAIKHAAKKFIFISTDKAVKPSSVMGATKRMGEMICQTLNKETKFISVRFGNVLDSRGSVIPIFREQIKKRGPVEVTHPEMKRFFMTNSEACLLVLQSGAMGQGGEVFVLDMGEPIRILDLAKEMIKLSGFEPDKDIPIVFTKPRPGEKLVEEILTAEEGTVATQNQKIFIAKLSDVSASKIKTGLDKLKDFVKMGDKENIVKTLKSLIPLYNSENK